MSRWDHVGVFFTILFVTLRSGRSFNVFLVVFLVSRSLRLTCRYRFGHTRFSSRAKETYSKRSVGNKYEIISKWLLTGLAVVISRTNWNILSKNRTLTMTPRNILHGWFRWGYPADEEDKTRKPYAQPHPNSLIAATWQDQVFWMSHAGYVQVTEAFNTARMRQGYYGTINQNNPVVPDTVSEQVTHPSPAQGQGLEQSSTSSSSEWQESVDAPPMGHKPTQPSWQAVSQDTVLSKVAALDHYPTTGQPGILLHWERGTSQEKCNKLASLDPRCWLKIATGQDRMPALPAFGHG